MRGNRGCEGTTDVARNKERERKKEAIRISVSCKSGAAKISETEGLTGMALDVKKERGITGALNIKSNEGGIKQVAMVGIRKKFEGCCNTRSSATEFSQRSNECGPGSKKQGRD